MCGWSRGVARPHPRSAFHPIRVALAWLMALVATAQPVPLTTPEGFAVPQPGTRFHFPRDHGSHPEFALEWWYVTGHLFEADGTRHGFQATFFRRAAPPQTNGTAADSAAFGQAQLFLAHMALLDGRSGRFLHQERLNREGWDAFARTDRLDVANGNWSIRQPATNSGVLELRGSIRAEAGFAFTLTPRKPLVVFGTNGVSRKAAEPTAASHYLTFTRLAVSGSLQVGERTVAVTGEAWMDHEFSSSQLGAGQVGWDWSCLQLRDGRELMTYRLRRADGTTDPSSTLAWIDRDGRVQHVGPAEFTWRPLTTWRSPATGATYPARTALTTRDPATGQPVTFTLEPLAADQELTGAGGGIPYWEGACRVLDAQGREIGNAFMELTGYAGSMQGRL